MNIRLLHRQSLHQILLGKPVELKITASSGSRAIKNHSENLHQTPPIYACILGHLPPTIMAPHIKSALATRRRKSPPTPPSKSVALSIPSQSNFPSFNLPNETLQEKRLLDQAYNFYYDEFGKALRQGNQSFAQARQRWEAYVQKVNKEEDDNVIRMLDDQSDLVKNISKSHEEDIKKLSQSHEEELAAAQSTYQAKMAMLRKRCEQLEQENKEKSQAWAKEKAEMQAQIAAVSLPPSPPPSPPPHASPPPPTKSRQKSTKKTEKHEKPPPTPPATPIKTTTSPPTSPQAPTSSSSTPPPTYAQVASRELSSDTPTKHAKPHETSPLNPQAPTYTPPHRRQKACMNMDDLFKKFGPSAQCSNSNWPIKFKRSNGSFPAGSNAKLPGQSHAWNSANFAATSANSASATPTFSKAFSMPSSTPQRQSPNASLRQHGMEPPYWSTSPPQASWSPSTSWLPRKSLENNGIAMLLQGLSQLVGNMGHGLYGQCIR